jgi:hypothetical protein
VCHAEQRLLRQRSSAKVNSELNSARSERAESEQCQKVHRIVNSDCPVHHRTVRWARLSELQRSNPNGWVTWLAHRTVSGGAPDCPVRPSTGIQVFNHCIQYKSSRLHSKTQNKRSNPLQVPIPFQRLSGL